MCCITELAGKKELEGYNHFLTEYSQQLKGIEEALDDTFGDAWEFTLDPIALQVRQTQLGREGGGGGGGGEGSIQAYCTWVMVQPCDAAVLSLQTSHYEHATLLEIIKTDHKVRERGREREGGREGEGGRGREGGREGWWRR